MNFECGVGNLGVLDGDEMRRQKVHAILETN